MNDTPPEDRFREWLCAWCSKKEFTPVGPYPWANVPFGWLRRYGIDHDDADLFVCSPACALNHVNGLQLWEEYAKLSGGIWGMRRWLHVESQAKMAERYGDDWASKLIPEHRDRPAHYAEADDGVPRPEADAIVRQFVRGPNVNKSDICFCDWCLTEWIGKHNCPKSTRGTAVAIVMGMGLEPGEPVEVPIMESAYAWMVKKEATKGSK